MVFSSTIFIFVFLPIVLLAYYTFGKKIKNYILLTASLLFYAWGGVSYLKILIHIYTVSEIKMRLVFQACLKKKNVIWKL